MRPTLGFYSLSGWTSHHKNSWKLEAERLDVVMIVSLWNLTGISAALLPMCLSNFRAIEKVWTRISRFRNFARSCGKDANPLNEKRPRWRSAEIRWKLMEMHLKLLLMVPSPSWMYQFVFYHFAVIIWCPMDVPVNLLVDALSTYNSYSILYIYIYIQWLLM